MDQEKRMGEERTEVVGDQDKLLILAFVAQLLAETKIEWKLSWVEGIRDWGRVKPPTPPPPPGEVFRTLADAADGFEPRQ